MRVLELFSGTGNLSRIARERGHKTLTVDLYESADLQVDLLEVSAEELVESMGGTPSMIWASPICTGFSVAAIGKSWINNGDGTFTPKSDAARLSLALLNKTVELIKAIQPATWFIENPRGMARRMPVMQDLQRATVTYCQYGESRMKPTDIWFDADWTPRAACKNGDPCHEAAPRGSRTGTQGIKSVMMRSRLPDELCSEVIEAAERRA